MKTTDAFVDEVKISVEAGAGGNGCVSLRREKFVPFGGPDGGDGGDGGDVVMIADRNLATLVEQRMHPKIQGENGAHGKGRNKNGRSGRAVEIHVPVGTIIHDSQSGLLADLANDGERYVVAQGGRGGKGNSQFATATRQTPDFAERGQPGRIRSLRLTLKLLADVGLVGFPNAGKSTLLSRVSGARPRVAAYPFTTLNPVLGVAEVDDKRFVVADIPGLIEGASDGAGLGDRFLRHIERTRLLVHLIDAGTAFLEERDPLEGYDAIRHELGNYEPSLLERPEIVVLNKADLIADRDVLATARAALAERGRPVHILSSATGEGIDELLRAVSDALNELDDEAKA